MISADQPPQPVTGNTRSHRRWLLSILLLALLLRIGATVGLQWVLENRLHRPFLITGDAEGYWELGRKLAHGETYSVHQPPRLVHRMPGFPAILAGSMWLFGESFLAARLVLALLGTCGVWLVYRAGRTFGDEFTGLLAAGLAAVSPTFVLFSVLILSETAFAVALMVNVLAAHQTYCRTSQPEFGIGQVCCWGALTGCSVALAVMMRPSWLLAAPIEAVLLAALSGRQCVSSNRRDLRWRGAVAGVCLCAASWTALLPWGLRNLSATGHFTVTTFWSGPSLYDGLHPRATGESDMRFFDDDRLSDSLTEYEIDREYSRRAWAWARENPQRVLELSGTKAARYWAIWPNASQFQYWPVRGAVGFFTLMIFGFTAWGLGLARRGLHACSQQGGEVPDVAPLQGSRADRIWSVAVLAGPVLYFALIHLVFVGSLRYRLPAEYPLLVLAGWGLRNIWVSRSR